MSSEERSELDPPLHPKVVLTTDIKPSRLSFHGRNIDIESEDGTGFTTKVTIDGREIEGIFDISVHVRTGEVITVDMKMYDILAGFKETKGLKK